MSSDVMSVEELLKLSSDEIVKLYSTKSNAIRGLGQKGVKPAEIAKALNIRYQHARNVLGRELKREVAAQRKLAQSAQMMTRTKEEVVKVADDAK